MADRDSVGSSGGHADTYETNANGIGPGFGIVKPLQNLYLSSMQRIMPTQGSSVTTCDTQVGDSGS